MTNGEILDNYLNGLSVRERAAKIHDIKEVCRISTDVMYDWRHGRSNIKFAYRCKINEALGFELFNEDTISVN